ncbi:MAG: hypothetical protein AABY10_00085, partial [Nanoarchaeota archaeon]
FLNLENTGSQEIAGFQIKIYTNESIGQYDLETFLLYGENLTINLTISSENFLNRINIIPQYIIVDKFSGKKVYYDYENSIDITLDPKEALDTIKDLYNKPIIPDKYFENNTNKSYLPLPNITIGVNQTQQPITNSTIVQNDSIQNNQTVVNSTVSVCSQGQDTDRDLLPDLWEAHYNLNSNSVDSDNDKIPDTAEDLDLDGFTNIEEFEKCKSPLDKNSKPSQSSLPFILTYDGSYVNGLGLNDNQAWEKYKVTTTSLKNIGFTHIGVKSWSGETYPSLTSQRINELRSLSFKFILFHSPGHEILEDKNKLDANIHSTNSQNLKYFGAFGFNPSSCSSSCSCSSKPHRNSLDPGYNGSVWQEDLNLLKGVLNSVKLREGELVMLDEETWGPLSSDVINCYPNAFSDGGRYSGSQNEREAAFFINLLNRGLDLRKVVKSDSANPLLSF